MREHLLQSWPQIRAFPWGFLGICCVGAGVYFGAQRQHHRDVRQAIRAVDIAWEVCRAAEGLPAKHALGGVWMRTDILARADVARAGSVAGGWAWVDATGRLTGWPGREDDASNEDEDVCGEAWRAGHAIATED